MWKKWIYLLLAVSLLGSCKPGKHLSGREKQNIQTNEIIYHNFSAQKDLDLALIEDIGITRVEGKIKDNAVDPLQFNNPVSVVFLDKSDNPVFSTFIEHPLVTVFEYSSPDGQLGKTTQMLDSASFFIRYNQNKRYSSIAFKTNPGINPRIDQKIILEK